MNILRGSLAFALIVMPVTFAHSVAHAAKAFPPPPRAYVYDEANVIAPNSKTKLYATLANEDQKTGDQILIAVFKSLDGEDPVDYTNRLFKYWNPGKKGKDNGVLIAAYLAEHKIRIEVGYGLEPTLTDAKTRMIIENTLTPAFRASNYELGFENSVAAILGVLHPEQSSAAFPTPIEAMPSSSEQRGGFPIVLIFIMIIFLLRIIGGRRRGAGFLAGLLLGGGGGGFSSGGGGGFGGFSGGGGSSGGGGASGSW
jgi:uncharacterized protein